MSGYTIDEARRIAINCASSYKSSLEDKQFIIIYRDKDTNMIKHIVLNLPLLCFSYKNFFDGGRSNGENKKKNNCYFVIYNGGLHFM